MTEARGVVISHFGDTPHLARLSVPALAPDEVLISVQAASVNAFDWKAAEGRFKDSFDYQFPVTIGRDYAGVVVAAGPSVTRVTPGDPVFGYFTGQQLHRGSFATHLWCSASDCFVVRPAGLSAEVAACLPLCGVVALRCVSFVAPAARAREPGLAGSAEPGLAGRPLRVLVVGAPGGTGSFAVQLLAARSAHVIATGPSSDEAYLRDLGAASVVAPGASLVSRVRSLAPEGLDGLVDLVSYRPGFEEHASLLRSGGRAASVHRSADEAWLSARGLHGLNAGSSPDPDLLASLASLALDGTLRVPITARYTLDEAPAALADARDQHSRGKRLITVAR